MPSDDKPKNENEQKRREETETRELDDELSATRTSLHEVAERRAAERRQRKTPAAKRES